MTEALDFLRWAGDKWGLGVVVGMLWAYDRYRLEKLLEKSSDRFIELGQTTADTLATMKTILLERLPSRHDDR
jgi:hypothetical protein